MGRSSIGSRSRSVFSKSPSRNHSPFGLEPFRQDFQGPAVRRLDDEDQARALSDNVFILPRPTLVILELSGVKPGTSQQDDGDLSVIAIEPLYGWDPSPGSATPLLDKMSERTLSVRFNWKERDLADPRKAVDKNGTATFLFVPKIHGGPGLLISFEVGGSFNIRLNKDWRFKLTPSVNAWPTCSFASTSFPNRARAGLSQPSIKLGFEGGSEEDPLYRFGKEDGSHLEFGQFEIEIEFSTAVAGVRAVSRKSELVLNLDKSGDGFLSQILPGEKRIPLNLGLGWSTERGFFIDGGKGNVIKQTNPPPPTPIALLRRLVRRRCRGRRRRAKGTPRMTRISIASRLSARHSVRRVFSFFH